MSVTTTGAVGVFQSDVILHSAIVEGIADLRRNPWLLDYCFASLAQDDLTSKLYGEKQIKLAKEWLLRTNIPVVMNMHAESATYPCISIAIASSDEEENTLSDVHYDPTEDNSDQWPALYGPFTPVSYSLSTGIMKLPADILGKLIVASGMVIIDRRGNQYPILDVTDDQTIVLATNIATSFNGALIKGQPPSYSLELESCNFKEVYSLGVHVTDDGKGTTLAWLYAILKFILLRYRQSLLEARGIERTTLNFTPPKMDIEGPEGEQRYLSRYCTMTGHVREVWPKRLLPKITSVSTLVKEDHNTPPTVITDIDPALYDTFGNPIGS